MKIIPSPIRTALDNAKGKNILLLPGELACRWLKVKDEESKMLLRLFVNLTVYGKVSVAILLIALGFD